MFSRLARRNRFKAGWTAALVYLLTVLAPTFAMALPGQHAVAHCLVADDMIGPAAAMPSQHAGDVATSERDLLMDMHSGHHGHTATTGDDRPHQMPTGSHSMLPCCGMTGAPALPAAAVDLILRPRKIVPIRSSARSLWIADSPLRALYRPPIA